MADAAAAPAPAAGTPAPQSNGAANGASQTPLAGAQPAKSPTQAGQMRGPDGKFAPKPGEAAPSNAEVKAELQKLRVRGEIKAYGKTESVDEELSQEDILNRLQKLRGYELRMQKATEREQHALRLADLAKADPIAFLRELGADPDAIAEQRLAERAKLSMMTEEQRAIHERDEKIRQYEAADQQRKANAAKDLKERQDKLLIQRTEQEFAMVAEQHGLEKTYGDLYRYADAREKLLRASGGVPPTPAEVAQMAKAGLDQDVERSLAPLNGQQLIKRLGSKRVALIAEALLAQHEATHGVGNPAAPAAPTSFEPPKPREYIDTAELNRRLRDLSIKK